MEKKQLTHEEYRSSFPKGAVRKTALENALANRKFEIDLYWRRATYFWTFIGAAFAAFFAIHAAGIQNKQFLSVIIACLGLVFSFAWYCVNRGSKKWQENWEKHVDLLEDEITGPLYKTVLSRNDPESIWQHIWNIFTGPASFSVSKINQLISFYIFIIWGFLLYSALPEFDLDAPLNWPYFFVVSLSLLTCLSFLGIGRTYDGNYWHIASIRESVVRPRPSRAGDGTDSNSS